MCAAAAHLIAKLLSLFPFSPVAVCVCRRRLFPPQRVLLLAKDHYGLCGANVVVVVAATTANAQQQQQQRQRSTGAARFCSWGHNVFVPLCCCVCVCV